VDLRAANVVGAGDDVNDSQDLESPLNPSIPFAGPVHE
jgi:hypothetical protein